MAVLDITRSRLLFGRYSAELTLGDPEDPFNPLCVRASTVVGSRAACTLSAVNLATNAEGYPDFVELKGQPFKKVFMGILVSLCLWHSCGSCATANVCCTDDCNGT